MALILVVDDDARIRHLLHDVLAAGGFTVRSTHDGHDVPLLVKTERPEAIVLDLKMPRVSGIEALRALRAAGEDVPVLVLTGMSDEDYILHAFEAGADDFVTKPFQPRVLVARLNALLRRRSPLVETVQAERVGDVSLNPRTHEANIGVSAIPLTPTEYQLLRVLMRGAGRVFTAADLLVRVWGPAYVGQDDIVRANIYRLRHKLEPQPAEPRYILGRRGLGYFFAVE